MSTDRMNMLKKMLEEDPEDSFVQFAIAKEYEQIGDETSARNFYTSLLEKDPEYIGAYYHLGKLLERQNKENEAIKIYRQGIEFARKNADHHAANELKAALLALDEEE